MAVALLLLILLMVVAGLVIAFGHWFAVPLGVVVAALAVILVGAAAFGIDSIRESRANGDGRIVAIARGIWVAAKTAFEFVF